MEGFYKKTGDVAMFGTKITNKDYALNLADKDTYTYPVDGWRYFATKADAYEYYCLIDMTLLQEEAEAENALRSEEL